MEEHPKELRICYLEIEYLGVFLVLNSALYSLAVMPPCLPTIHMNGVL